MINLIVRRFVKNSEDTKNPDVRSAVGRLCGWIGILCNVFLFGIKFVIGIIVNSVSIQADAINNLTDAGSNIIAIFSFYLSNKPADKDHPFGHERTGNNCFFVCWVDDRIFGDRNGKRKLWERSYLQILLILDL